MVVITTKRAEIWTQGGPENSVGVATMTVSDDSPDAIVISMNNQPGVAMRLAVAELREALDTLAPVTP